MVWKNPANPNMLEVVAESFTLSTSVTVEVVLMCCLTESVLKYGDAFVKPPTATGILP